MRPATRQVMQSVSSAFSDTGQIVRAHWFDLFFHKLVIKFQVDLNKKCALLSRAVQFG